MWLSRVVSQIGNLITTVALVLYVEETHESGVAVGAVLLAAAIPTLLGPLAGTLADRVDQKKLMMTCEVGQGVLVAVIALWLPPLPVLLALVFATAVLSTAFRPAGTSAVPSLVLDHELLSANAWMGTALNMGVAVGPLLGGLLVEGGGVRLALFADAATFGLSALLLVGVPSLRPAFDADRLGFFAMTREGLSFVRRHQAARAVILVLFLGIAFGGVDNVALVFLAKDELGTGAAGFGLLSSIFGVGMIVVSLLLIRWKPGISAATLFLIGFAGTGFGNLGAGVAPALAVAVGAQLIAGAGNGAANIADQTFIQQTVPKAMLGRVFGLSSSAANIGGSLAYAAGGVLLDLTSPRTAFVVSGIGVLGVVALGAAMLRGVEPVR